MSDSAFKNQDGAIQDLHSCAFTSLSTREVALILHDWHRNSVHSLGEFAVVGDPPDDYIQGIHYGFSSVWNLRRAEHSPSGCWRLHVWTLKGNPRGSGKAAASHDAGLALLTAAATTRPYRAVDSLGASVQDLPREILGALDAARSCREIEESLADVALASDVRVIEYKRDAVGEVTWLQGKVDDALFTYRVDVYSIPTVHASLGEETIETRVAHSLVQGREVRHLLLRSLLAELLKRRRRARNDE